MATINLGKLLPVGDTFYSTTKRMHRRERIVLRKGYKGFFTKGKRKYYGEVLRIVETRVGKFYNGDMTSWQFTYEIKIIEN